MLGHDGLRNDLDAMGPVQDERWFIDVFAAGRCDDDRAFDRCVDIGGVDFFVAFGGAMSAIVIKRGCRCNEAGQPGPGGQRRDDCL